MMARLAFFLAGTLLLALAEPAAAQLGLPRLPSAPRLSLPEPRLPAAAAAIDVLDATLPRAQRVQTLLARHGDRLEPDPDGAPFVRREFVLVSPRAEWVAAARALGFVLRRELTLAPLDERLLVLAAPDGLDAAQALQRLRAIDPALLADYHHVYLPGAAGSTPGAGAAPDPSAMHAQAAAPLPPARLGLVDAGIDPRAAALRGLGVQRHGCSGGSTPSAHGAAVAARLAAGAGTGGTLLAADVYCGTPTGASVAALADALAWLAREAVPVINISLVGPPNAGLARWVAALQQRGHLLVAAVGNDGPAAPPLYPAAYDGVVAVTGVDDRGRVLPEAGRGAHLHFAARGVGAEGGQRGTSFAAPIVAARLGRLHHAVDPAAATRAVDLLARDAVDLGEPGRDSVYGFGLIEATPRPAHAAR